MKVAGDLVGMACNVPERSRQTGDELLGFGIVSVVRGLKARVMPYWFDGVELGTIRGQRRHLEPTMSTQPVADLRCSMIRDIVMNENDLPSRIATRQLLQELGIGLPVEHGVLAEMKPGLLERDGPKNLLRVALAGGGNARLFAAWRPRLIQAGILAEARLVFKDQDGLLFAGFFLSLG